TILDPASERTGAALRGTRWRPLAFSRVVAGRGQAKQVEVMPPDEASHAAHVEAWLDVAAKNLPPAQLVTLFERALDALWQRVHFTLGEVTLTAIVDRVLYTASEKYPFLSTLKVEGSEIRFGEFSKQGAVQHDRHLPEAVRC